MADKEKKPKLHEMHIKRAASGGFIAKHPNEHGSLNHEDGRFHHVVPNMDALHDHMEEHLGEPEEGEEDTTGKAATAY